MFSFNLFFLRESNIAEYWNTAISDGISSLVLLPECSLFMWAIIETPAVPKGKNILLPLGLQQAHKKQLPSPS